jgi:hypothetical protein
MTTEEIEEMEKGIAALSARIHKLNIEMGKYLADTDEWIYQTKALIKRINQNMKERESLKGDK